MSVLSMRTCIDIHIVFIDVNFGNMYVFIALPVVGKGTVYAREATQNANGNRTPILMIIYHIGSLLLRIHNKM